MKYRFLLNDIEISEPIGFDGFNPSIERTDHHGMSVSVSINKIGFYGNALDIIDNAYKSDIDIELPFVVEVLLDKWTPIYSGVVDLATYELVTEDGACRINCNVGEIGFKTTFNNRYDTKVELNRETSLDGDILTKYTMLTKEIEFPSKEIILFNTAKIEADITSTIDYHETGANQSLSHWFKIPLGSVGLNKIDDFNSEEAISRVYSLKHVQIDSSGFPVGNIIIYDDACCFVFSENNQMEIDKNFNIKINVKFDATIRNYISGDTCALLIYHCDKNGHVLNLLKYEKLTFIGQSVNSNISLNEKIIMEYGDKIAVLLYNIQYDAYFAMDYNNKTGTSISISALSQTDPSNHNISLVHESLSRLSEITSGLTVKSDWYGRYNSEVNPVVSGFGGGSLKAILNGYELRNMDLTSGERPPVKLSFKELFESLNAIDNIGWGFEEGENDELYLRVERWQWFYKDNIIMTINHPNNVKRSIQADKVYTRIKIGYEKYLDEQEINAIDTFHTNREFSTGLKAIDKQLEKMSKLIADPYAIEVTRRQQFNKDTSNWKYDEDVFVVALAYGRIYNLFSIEVGMADTTIINSNNIEASTVISPNTMYNVRISPQRNAIRWAECFFDVISSRISLNYTAGTGNVTAKGKPIWTNYPHGNHFYLEDSASGQPVSERDNISRKAPLLKPEILSFDFPITFDQYAAILANPYGKIIVDGEECYIQKVIPNLIERKASFELIPKNV